MDNFIIHAAIAYLLLAVGGLLWTQFDSVFFQGLLAASIGMISFSFIKYLLTDASYYR